MAQAAEAGMILRAAQRGKGLAPIWRAVTVLLLVLMSTLPAIAADKAQLLVTQEQGYARMIVVFPNRNDLPSYSVKYENGVLAINFDQPVDVLVPDVELAIPDYATIARVDPDNKGIRIGLRNAVNINRMEAGEKLFIDLLPANWQGLPPALPAEVVAELTERAKRAAEKAAQDQKAAEAKRINPTATVRVGENPTFLRLQFDWSADTKAEFVAAPGSGTIDFDWPVSIDLYPLEGDLPSAFKGAKNSVSANGSRVVLNVGEDVVPRFYELGPRSLMVDIDIDPEEGLKVALELEAKVKAAREKLAAAATQEQNEKDKRLNFDDPEAQGGTAIALGGTESPGGAVSPTVSVVGNTVRIAFPFAADTPAAVFRRGNIVWMVFDTAQIIDQPPPSDALSAIASAFEVLPAGDTKVVRLDLSADRLATLASEGRSWVLSLGDVLLAATEPMTLSRVRMADGTYTMKADVERPGGVHILRDPVVGDTLRVVTVMPPARGLSRDLNYVDFDALRSAQGLVIKPNNDELDVSIAEKNAVISAAGGLTLSAVDATRAADIGQDPIRRESFVDLTVWQEEDPRRLAERLTEQMSKASSGEGRLRDQGRLDLAALYIANNLVYEAIGVLGVAGNDLATDNLRPRAKLLRAMADTLATRTTDALATLNTGNFPQQADALMWRTIAKTDSSDFIGARLDALASEAVIDNYPEWVQHRFKFAAIRAAVETKDTAMAIRLMGELDFAKLDSEEVSHFQLMQGRIAELEGQEDNALDSYGQVIATDVRPTRAEAVYRTLAILKKNGRIDLDKATQTLAAEALLWRGDRLEASMDSLLAQLYFEHKDYRLGFDTVRQAAANFPENETISALADEAERQFEGLFLNGGADQLPDVDALALFYDFRQLTPPGARGDEMIRNLARRLVKVDLLAQAGDLLQYQVDNRLEGIGRAQVAADLAAIRIADRDPQAALRVLSDTRIAQLPPELERQRRVLEARAMIDAGRQDLALDMISKLKGRDTDLLRIDGYWKSKNYSEAANLLEVLHTPEDPAVQMTKQERMGVIKAAVGYVLAGDKLSLARVRSKFSDQMSKSEEWPLFDYVTSQINPQAKEFSKIVAEVAAVDSLDAFMSAYKKLYAPTDAVTPSGPAAPKA
jgi:hypothetical protein